MAEEMNFTVESTALQTAQRTEIKANFDEVKAYLTEALEPYKTLTVSEDDVQAAKAIQARINKVKTRIDEQRKSVKRMWGEPLDRFEARCKELTALCDEAYANIGGQVKAFDKAKKDAKLNELLDFYSDATKESPEVRGYLPFQRIYNERWLNNTYSIGKAKLEISSAIGVCISELEQIRTLHSQFEPALLDIYKRTGSVSNALSAHISYQNEQERKRKEAAERATTAKSESEKAQAEESTSAPTQEPVTEQSDVITTIFKVTCTKDQLRNLGIYMREHGIKYGRA